jgi:hypothetical protein
MKKTTKIVLSIIGIIIIYFISSFVYSYYQKISFEKELTETISNNSEINLQEITEFEWDKFYIFGPYTPDETFTKNLGFEWSGATSIGQDEYQVLVFVKNDKVVMSSIFPRYEGGDFTVNLEDDNYVYSPSEAIFIKNDYKLIKK